ncbi:protein TolA [Rubrivivax gelatinosus]|nr:protein TolA [Rubrivivax gelatinosus]
MAQDALQPRPPDSLLPAGLLALLVHAALIIALTISVDWHSSEPETISAELWAAVPTVAAPPPAPEPPPPEPEPKPEPKPATPPPAPPKAAPDRDAEIAVERAERRKKEEEREKRELAEKQAAEQKKAHDKAEADKKAKAEAEKKEKEKQKADAERQEREAQKKAEQQKQAQQKAEAQRLAKLREDQLKRMQNSLGGSGTGAATSTGTAARDAGPSASYGGKLRALIRQNIVFTDSVAGNPVAEIEVRAGPTGTIIARRLLKSSGEPAWDEAVLRAIDRIGTLPRDVDGRVPSTIVITSRPKD